MLDRAVVNAGPLVARSLLDQLDLLPALFAECWVPQTVFNEVAVAGIGKPGAKSLQDADWQARVRRPRFIPCLSGCHRHLLDVVLRDFAE